MRESRTYGSVRAKAEWLSYSTIIPRSPDSSGTGMETADVSNETPRSLPCTGWVMAPDPTSSMRPTPTAYQGNPPGHS
jgi:hypothetical protein